MFSGMVATVTADTTTGDSATIVWGDGGTSAGTITHIAGSEFAVTGLHDYAHEGTYPVTVTLNGGSLDSTSSMANVADADMLKARSTNTVTATEFTTFSGIVANFSNTGYLNNSASDFAGTINWGDGTTTTGIVSGSGGTLTVSGTHVYAEEGTETATVVLTDAAPGTATATASVNVDVALPAGVGFLAGVRGDGTIETFVQNLYRELLGREADAVGDAAWVAFVEAHDDANGRYDVIQSFINSPEYKIRYVTTAYEVFLDRAPDAAGLQFWTQKMGNPGTPGQNTGSADEKYIVAAMTGSDEFYVKSGATPQSWINALYEDFFGRAADGAGMAFWTNELNVRGAGNRDGIVRDLLTSPEAAHDLFDTFYPAPGNTASTPLSAPGTMAGAGLTDLALLTGAGWENLYLESPYGNAPEGNDAFFTSLEDGGNWDDIQLLLLTADQYYTNSNIQFDHA